jgi:hypothetical protein
MRNAAERSFWTFADHQPDLGIGNAEQHTVSSLAIPSEHPDIFAVSDTAAVTDQPGSRTAAPAKLRRRHARARRWHLRHRHSFAFDQPQASRCPASAWRLMP